ncbi:MAG: lysophospholipid acyltransferase family protein [Anaerolineae bacterium]
MDKKYRRIRNVLRILFRHLGHLEVVGVEHVPLEGAFILTTNHISRLDTPLLGVTCPRQIHALVAAKYKHHPLFRWFVNAVDGIWVRRTAFDREALMKALRVLKEGGVIGIAPEGTRSPTATLQPGRPGAAFLAARLNVPIVPVGVAGTEQFLPSLASLRYPELRVTYGEPFRLPKTGRLSSEEMAEATDLIMRRIASLLPSAYRGIYAGVDLQVASG